MPEDTTSPIDNSFWFAFSRDLLNGSFKRLDDSIKSIEIYLNASLIFITTAAPFTIKYNELKNPWHIFIFSLPYVLILFGKWFIEKAKVPKYTQFQFSIASDIKDAFDEILKSKKQNVEIAIYYSFISTFTIAFVLIFGFYIGINQKNESTQKEKIYGFDLALEKSNQTILVSGFFPEETILEFEIYKMNEKDTIREVSKFLNNKYGYFYHQMKPDSLIKDYKVKIQWNTSTDLRSITKSIKVRN